MLDDSAESRGGAQMQIVMVKMFVGNKSFIMLLQSWDGVWR